MIKLLSRRRTPSIDEGQRRFWDDNGYLVVEGFFNDSEIRTVEESVERAWRERPPNVIIDDLESGERIEAGELAEGEADRERRVKINDLYLIDAGIRSVASSDRVVALLSGLLGDEPVLINTLNLDHGSQQPRHLDTLYMTPTTEYDLIVTWMALEDVHPDSGPLVFWPGSHKIPPYRFSSGLLHGISEEMGSWNSYMDIAAEREGLAQRPFLAKRGDLFIWHALLLHGGSAITDRNRTRKSLVTHFWSKRDCETFQLNIRPVDGGAGFWFDRAPQAVEGESITWH